MEIEEKESEPPSSLFKGYKHSPHFVFLKNGSLVGLLPL